MNIHEYQAKELYRKYDIPCPKGVPAFSVEEAKAAAEKLIAETGSEVVVVKAQIHAGGRGKGGGVKVVKGVDAAEKAAKELMGMTLVTHQTGPEGKLVQRLIVELEHGRLGDGQALVVADRRGQPLGVAHDDAHRLTALEQVVPDGSCCLKVVQFPVASNDHS